MLFEGNHSSLLRGSLVANGFQASSTRWRMMYGYWIYPLVSYTMQEQNNSYNKITRRTLRAINCNTLELMRACTCGKGFWLNVRLLPLTALWHRGAFENKTKQRLLIFRHFHSAFKRLTITLTFLYHFDGWHIELLKKDIIILQYNVHFEAGMLETQRKISA